MSREIKKYSKVYNLFKKIIILNILLLVQIVPGQNSKVNGVSFVSSRIPISDKHVEPVVKLNANYAAIMPFAFMRDLNSTTMAYNNRQYYGETITGAQQYAEQLQKKGIKIMMKPQVWIARGAYTGFIEMENDADWKSFETSYLKFILEYAKVAQNINAEIFCIGTELEKFVTNRPEFWFDLIDEVKKIYKGKLTYAANWDEFKRTPFWSKLDFIGVDAYFPISDQETPSVEACIEGWKPHKAIIKGISDRYKKPVLFTEYGYRSVNYTAREPWRSDRELNVVNLKAQVNATQAVFDSFWNEDWFAGGFIWKWFHNYETSGGIDNSRFTPQNKPVEELLRAKFNEYK